MYIAAGSVISLLLAASLLVFLISTAAVLRVRPPSPLPAPARPSMSLIMPIRGADAFTRRNLEAAARACAEAGCELIVAMEEESDPAYASASTIPGIRLVKSGPSGDRSGKVHNMAAGVRLASGEILAFLDADVELRPEALVAAGDRLVADPSLAAVSAIPYYRAVPGAGGALVRLYSGAVISAFIGQAMMRRQQNLIGGFMAIRRADLDRLGTIERYAHHLSDDGAIGRDLLRAGRRIDLIPVVLYMDDEPIGIVGGLAQVRKWYRVARAHMGPVVYGQMLMLSPVALSLLCAIALAGAGLPNVGVGAVATAVLVRLLLSAAAEHALGARRGGVLWLLAPAADLICALIWLESLPARSITWKGRRYRLGPDGTVAPYDSGPVRR